MEIYKPDQPSRHVVMVTPGLHCAEWVQPDGKPKTFTVDFSNGCARVPDNLGAYMVDNGMARRSPLLLPTDFKGALQ